MYRAHVWNLWTSIILLQQVDDIRKLPTHILASHKRFTHAQQTHMAASECELNKHAAKDCNYSVLLVLRTIVWIGIGNVIQKQRLHLDRRFAPDGSKIVTSRSAAPGACGRWEFQANESIDDRLNASRALITTWLAMLCTTTYCTTLAIFAWSEPAPCRSKSWWRITH